MAGVALSDHDAVIRDLFDEDKMQELTGDEGPVVSRIRKLTEWSGDQWLLPIQYATNQSVSATFATMQSLAVFNKFKQFAIDPYEYFGRVLFSRRFLKQAKGENAMAYVDGMENEWAGLLKTLTLERAFQFYGNGSGCRGQLTTAADPLRPTDVTTVTAYLQNPQDSVYFYVGMEVGLAAAATGGASRANSVTLDGIDPETGKLTADIRWDTITGGAAEDYVHRKGDYDLDLLGLAAWVPPTAPGAAPFEGVVRTAHTAALGGNRLTLGGLSIAEGLRTLAAQCRIYGAQSVREKSDGGMSLICTMHTDRWTELETELHTDGIRDFVHEVGEFGFPAIRMRTPAGPVDVYGDPMCPYSYAWLLDTKTWKFRSAGKMPEIVDDDGQKILREAAANQFEGRAGWIAALGCGAPGNNGCLTF